MTPTVYRYRIKRMPQLLGVLVFGLMIPFFYGKALDTTAVVTLAGFIELSSGATRIFHWVLLGVVVLFVSLALVSLVVSLFGARRIELHATHLVVPKHLYSSKVLTIPYLAIEDLKLGALKKQLYLVIHHRGGEVRVAGGLLDSEAHFKQFVAQIAKASGRLIS